jgi:hypothetical protein
LGCRFGGVECGEKPLRRAVGHAEPFREGVERDGVPGCLLVRLGDDADAGDELLERSGWVEGVMGRHRAWLFHSGLSHRLRDRHGRPGQDELGE